MKPVTVSSTPGSTVISVSRIRIWTGVESAVAVIEMPDRSAWPGAERVHARTVRLRRFVEQDACAEAASRDGSERARLAAWAARSRSVGLVGGVDAERRDALLGGADEDQLVADAHEVERAVRRERRGGDAPRSGRRCAAPLGARGRS